MVEKRSDGPSTGLVIDTNINLSEPYAALVLDLDELLETGRAKIRKLSSDAFRDPANLEGDEEAQKKYERLREKTLNFGSHISWRKKDVDSTTEFIGKFENINPLLETRVLHGIGQILLDGAINPAKQDKIYTKYFGNVVIPSFLIHKASPNVFFEAWISCRFNKETSIFEHQLHSYNKICSYSKQTDIIHLPWNQGYSVEFLCSLAGDSDDEFEGITFKDGGRSDSKSEKKTAFCTGDGIFLLENSPMTKCIFPIKHDRTIIFGALYEVECFWNRVEECYIVLDLLKVYEKDLWMPVYKPNSSLFAEVHAHPTFRGIYESKIFGLLDDPFGSLALFHLGQFANTHIPVTVLDRNPSRHGQIRFSITSLARRDMDSSSILGLNNEIRVVDVDGVVVEGGVVSAEHSPIVFHFRADETNLPSPGTQVTFEALYDKRMDVFNITEWHLNKTRSKLPVGRETFSYAGSVSEEQTVYKATVRLVTIKGDAEMLYCEEFGLIDDCLNRVVLQENINNYDVWIKATIAQEGYEYPARTPYHIVAVDDEILAQEEPSNQETPILGPTTPIDACAPEIF